MFNFNEGEIPQGWQGEKHKAKLRQKDCDARWTKKQSRSYFGYKDHVKTDVKSKFIVKATVTAVNVHDSQEVKPLTKKGDTILYGDSAYSGEGIEKILKQKKIEGRICERGYRNKALTQEQKEALQTMLKSDIGILSAGTGFGKTVTAAALIAERRTNTIILVQTHTLLEQWKKAIKRFLNYEAGTIAAGKDTSTGIIDIAIIKSLTEKNSDAVKLRRHIYGMLIVDECHHVSAFGTENLVKSFRAKYVYGLTATPVRRDGRQKIIFMQCGQILYATTAKQMNRVQNFEHYFIPRFTSFHIAADNQANTQPSIQNYYSEMVKAEARNILIISDVKAAVKEGRTPLVLSDRIESLFSAAKIARLKNTASLLIANIAY